MIVDEITAQEISKRLADLASPQIAEHLARYFKTGKGGYGEGDLFLGIRVPVLRSEVKKCGTIALEQVQRLLISVFHEERLFALLLLVRRFAKGSAEEQAVIYQMYLNNTRFINNWDLVDSSARQIVGAHLEFRDRQILNELAQSKNLWERRISIIATFHFIGNNQFDDALKLAMQLLTDKEDLIHKATGWVLREIGKRDINVEKAFLQRYYKQMPRAMLRYAIEKFPEQERKKYLAGDI